MAKEENKRAKDCPDSHSLIKGQYDGIHDQKFMAIKQRITIANGWIACEVIYLKLINNSYIKQRKSTQRRSFDMWWNTCIKLSQISSRFSL